MSRIIQAKLLLDNNRYESWTWVTTDTRRTLNYDQDPWIQHVTRDELLEKKILNHDIVEFHISSELELVKFVIVHSIVRQTATLAGILLLQGNKTYGKTKNKYWYRCVLNDKRLPSFLIAVPWGGSKQSTFNKNPENRFVVFKYKSWEGMHPRGELIETLGNVSSLNAFYEYQLYCRSLQTSIQGFVKATRQALKEKTNEELIEQISKKYHLEDRTHEMIYSIDPKHCKDIDDAFSVEKLTDNQWRVSIYIACVPIWIDFLKLWNAFSKRVATIYLPDRKRPMMPTVLSDDLCSLHSGVSRIAISLDMIIETAEGLSNGRPSDLASGTRVAKKRENREKTIIIDKSFSLCKIKVSKNYDYKHQELLSLNAYKQFHDIAVELNQYSQCIDKQVLNKTTNNVQRVKQSHAVVSFWMIQMNYIVAKKLQEYNTGLFRITALQPCKPTNAHSLPREMLEFLQIWKSSGGSYVSLQDMPETLTHELLKLDAYVHITSPIRRLPDLLNMIELIRVIHLTDLTDVAAEFYSHWCSTEPLEFMNTSMRAIRRVQQDCEMITKITREPERTERNVEGYVFDGVVKTDGLYQYMVYFPSSEWRLITRCVSTKCCDEYSKQSFRIHLFEDGETMKKKIRVELL